MLISDEHHDQNDGGNKRSYIKDSIEAYRNIDNQKVRKGIFRHIILILIFAVIFTGLGAYVSKTMIREYEAESVLIYQFSDRTNSKEDPFNEMHLTLPSAVEMITLPAQFKAVKSILGLDEPIGEISGMVEVQLPARESNLINITVSGDDPNTVVDVANTLARVSVKNTQDMAKRQWQAAYAFFKNQEIGLKTNIDDQNRELANFRREHRFIGMDATGINAATVLRDVESQLQMANLDYKKMLVEYENLRREIGKIPDFIERSALADNALKGRITQLETALLDARIKYAINNPKVRALEGQLEDLKKSAVIAENDQNQIKLQETNPLKEKLNIDLISMQAKLRAAQKIREELEDIVKMSENKASNLSEEQVSFAEMVAKRERFENEIKSNLISQRSLEILLNLGKSDLEIYQLAENALPAKSNIVATLLPILGMLFGVTFGVILAGLIEVFDRKIRTSRQLASLYEIPCFATIPRIGGINPKQVDEKTLYYTRKISERIQIEHPLAKSIALASSVEGEGKSLWAYHLALYYKQTGKNVLLLELDHRNSPCFDRREKDQKCIEHFLRGQATINDLIIADTIDRIGCGYDVVMKELMKTDLMHNLWDQLNQIYDMIIVDAPGVVEEDYAINGINLADACLFVINSTKTPKGYVTESFETLEIYGIQPIGILLNLVKKIYRDSYQEKAIQRKRR